MRGGERLVRARATERADLGVSVGGDCGHGLPLGSHRRDEVRRHGRLRDEFAVATFLVDQGLELARGLPLLLAAALSLLHRTLIERRTIDALALVDGVHFRLDGGLLGGLRALLVGQVGHRAVRLHDLRQNLDVILADDYGFDARLAICGCVLA